MSPDQLSTFLQRYVYDPWSGDLSGLDETTTEDFVQHSDEGDTGLDDLKEIIRAARAGFPDITISVEETISEGDRLAYRWTVTGTHQGEYEGIAPTGRRITVSGMTIVHLRDGKVAEDRGESSSRSVEEQLTAAT